MKGKPDYVGRWGDNDFENFFYENNPALWTLRRELYYNEFRIFFEEPNRKEQINAIKENNFNKNSIQIKISKGNNKNLIIEFDEKYWEPTKGERGGKDVSIFKGLLQRIEQGDKISDYISGLVIFNGKIPPMNFLMYGAWQKGKEPFSEYLIS